MQARAVIDRIDVRGRDPLAVVARIGHDAAVAHDAGSALLALGALACLAAAAAAARQRGAFARLAFAAALGVAAASHVGVDGSLLEGLAVLAATVGLVVLVLERFGVVRRLSWLDALMGASAAGAVAAAFGAHDQLVVGVGGRRARWRSAAGSWGRRSCLARPGSWRSR
jgi:hypothetical protein